MDWTQTLVIIGVFAAFFIYLLNRLEGIGNKIGNLENRMTGMEAELKATNQRLSDFKTDMNQRLSTIEGYLVPRKVFRFEETDHKEEPKEN